MPKQNLSARRVLIVHAHPDDESLFTGHLIAERLAAGAEVFVLTLTRGERGKVKLEELKGLEGQLGAMGAFREGELRVAITELAKAGSGKLHHAFAGTRAYLDSGMRLTATGKPAKKRRLDELSLSAASTPVIAEDIIRVMLTFKPDAVVTYNPKGGYGHPDHKQAHHATAMALRQYRRAKRRSPQFWVISEPNERAEVSIGNAETAKFKKAALEAHASQVAISPETYAIVPGHDVRFDAPERFRRGTVSPLVMFRPIFTFFWAAPLGILLGIAGTLLHSVRAITSHEYPIGLVVSLTMVGALALSLRLLRSSRGALYVMTAAFISTVFWLAQEQPGGEVLILGNQIGDTWAYGSMIICAVVMLFPRIRKGTWRSSASGHR